MHPANQHTVEQLREVNGILLKAGLAETDPEIDAECDYARQCVLNAIRKLDPESAENPPPEEMDVAVFNLHAEGAGTLLIQKLAGQCGGGTN